MRLKTGFRDLNLESTQGKKEGEDTVRTVYVAGT
jgi:hypothetical protein